VAGKMVKALESEEARAGKGNCCEYAENERH